jgi:hypothetical protein
VRPAASDDFLRPAGDQLVHSGKEQLARTSARRGVEGQNYLAVLGLLGSVAMIGWLLVKGVNEERWKEQARVE